ncbi:putative membrane protein [Conyzicola nivalis]|uniref:Membrane protein n=1 Tax=Conyzicola nivalis TaxID=1477021 RepID=A0ABV2QPF4_9MICO
MTPVHGHGTSTIGLGTPILALAAVLTVAYVAAAIRLRRPGGRGWPAPRVVAAVLAFCAVSATLVGPIAVGASDDLAAHMAAHLAVGMLAPLLIVVAAPGTLALRALDVVPARRLSRLLRSGPVRLATHPLFAGTLYTASMWLLYTTPFGVGLTGNPLLHWVLLVHFLVAGCLFTASIVPVDPSPHRSSFRLRLTVFLLAAAAHSVLAKQIYAHPPPGTTTDEAQLGGLIMYYGGDTVGLAILVVMFTRQYIATRPRGRLRGHPSGVAAARQHRDDQRNDRHYEQNRAEHLVVGANHGAGDHQGAEHETRDKTP